MISSRPIVWLLSSTWFSFLHRRLKRLTELHERLYQRRERPSNYGILTGLFAFMMQSVLFTPPQVDSYVRESLNLLCFREVVEHYGLFFLHDLDMTLNTCLPEILQMDDAGVNRSLGISKHRIHRMQLKDIQKAPGPDVDSEQYPIGPTPTWRQLEQALEHQPWSILKRWEWPDELDEMAFDGDDCPDYISIASTLFQHFTSQIWAMLHDAWKVPSTQLLRPASLHDALEFWSLDKLHKCLASYVIHPCNAGLRGDILGQRMDPFSQRWRLYMDPSPGSDKGSRWDILREPYGLIGRYRQALKELPHSEHGELHTALETLFSYCQCLPHTTDKGVWSVEELKVVLLGNPTYYKINAIRSGRSGRRKPTHTSKTTFQNIVIQLAGYTKDMATRAVGVKKMLQKVVEVQRKNHKRSGKVRNFRVPPTRRSAQCIQEDDADSEPERSDKDEGESDGTLSSIDS